MGGDGYTVVSNIRRKPTDWHCHPCGAWNWKKNENCYQCQCKKHKKTEVWGNRNQTTRPKGLDGSDDHVFKQLKAELAELKKAIAAKDKLLAGGTVNTTKVESEDAETPLEKKLVDIELSIKNMLTFFTPASSLIGISIGSLQC